MSHDAFIQAKHDFAGLLGGWHDVDLCHALPKPNNERSQPADFRS